MENQNLVEVMVVSRDKLLKDSDFEGFKRIEDKDFIPVIISNHEYLKRDGALEKNQDFKQIIPYIIVINPQIRKVFGYKRFKKYPGMHETRLHNKFSIGLGGHIDKLEVKKDVFTDAMMREFEEEVKMGNYPLPKVFGFINSELTEVDRMHFAIAAIAQTTENIEKRENDEVVEEKFYSAEEVDSIMSDKSIQMDTWTRAVWPHVKKLLN